MNLLTHRVYIASLAIIVIFVFVVMALSGADYYTTGITERHFHEQNELLKPSGFIGHGLGIAGSGLMIIGVFGYMARKRFRRLSHLGYIKYWLEFHIFLCTLGPVLVLYHTSFKFGGIVAVSFWSMVAVVFSGIIGRFIYLQIPRTIEGRELSLKDLNSVEAGLFSEMKNQFNIDSEILIVLNQKLLTEAPAEEKNYLVRIIKRIIFERNLIHQFRKELKSQKLKGRNFRKAVRIIKSKIVLNRRIAWLSSMQNFLRYWHVAHLPFALIMLVIMVVHIIVAVLFGYKWIF